MGDAVNTIDPAGRRVIDVADLPTTVFGPRSPVWWGNTLMMTIESTTLLLLVVSYFYIRQNFDTWPPPNPYANPPIFKPLPDLLWSTVELVGMFASCGLMAWTNKVARELRPGATKLGLWLMLAVTLAVIYVRFGDFARTGVRWDQNAYASLVWTILGLHLTYLLAAAAEFFIMVLYLHFHPLDDHQAHDINLTGIYWYWVVATWVIVYGLVYFGARWL